MKYLSRSPHTTKKIAGLFAREILKRKLKLKNALTIGLTGELGSGKTTFIQRFASGLGLKRRLTSPTFLIVRRYTLQAARYKNLYHIDAYRLKKPKELSALDFKEVQKNPKNIILIEWADKIKNLLPKKIIWIKLGHGKRKNERTIKIQAEKPS